MCQAGSARFGREMKREYPPFCHTRTRVKRTLRRIALASTGMDCLYVHMAWVYTRGLPWVPCSRSVSKDSPDCVLETVQTKAAALP